MRRSSRLHRLRRAPTFQHLFPAMDALSHFRLARRARARPVRGVCRALARRLCPGGCNADRRLRRSPAAQRRGGRARRPDRIGRERRRLHPPPTHDPPGCERPLDHPGADRRPRASHRSPGRRAQLVHPAVPRVGRHHRARCAWSAQACTHSARRARPRRGRRPPGVRRWGDDRRLAVHLPRRHRGAHAGRGAEGRGPPGERGRGFP